MVNWLKKHRDFTLGLGSWGSIAIWLTIMIIFTAFYTRADWVIWLSTAIWLIFTLWLEVWYLKQKGRNPWNVLWLIPWGPLSILWLYNLADKKKQQSNQNKELRK